MKSSNNFDVVFKMPKKTDSFAPAFGALVPLLVANPARGGVRAAKLLGQCGGRKPVDQITDRAKRYRANAEQCRPGGPKICTYCGHDKNVGVHHIDGNEDNGKPRNLAWACKSCNAKFAVDDKRNGRGKRTRQNNPTAEGYPTFREYVEAAVSHRRGHFDAGGAVIHSTPEHLRREYAREIWRRRVAFGTASSRSAVPF